PARLRRGSAEPARADGGLLDRGRARPPEFADVPPLRVTARRGGLRTGSRLPGLRAAARWGSLAATGPRAPRTRGRARTVVAIGCFCSPEVSDCDHCLHSRPAPRRNCGRPPGTGRCRRRTWIQGVERLLRFDEEANKS